MQTKASRQNCFDIITRQALQCSDMEDKEADLNCQNSSPPSKDGRLGGSDDAPDPRTFARCYQLEALDMAIKQNTIVFLETGSGKTLIAVMLLKAFAHSFRKPGDSVAVFLVPTVVLVTQQARVIEMHTDLKVETFYGEKGVDRWNREIWKKKLEQNEVFVMTPQVLVDILRHRFFQLEKIKLLIFDECHHARKKHPYASIMTEFYHPQLKSNPTNLPKIFGMTASLVNTKGSRKRSAYARQIADIESLLHSKVYTVASESVLAKYVPFSTAKIMEYNHVEIPHEFSMRISSHLEELKLKHLQSLQNQLLDTKEESRTMKKMKKLHDTLKFCLTELGLLAAVKASDILSRKESNLVFWGENTDGKCDKIVREFSYDVLLALSKYLPDGECINQPWSINGDPNYLSSSKVSFLVNLILKYRTGHNMRCIIFVERVITAIVLKSLMHEIEDLHCLGIEYMAGNNAGLQSQTREEQFKIVESFKGGKVKIIVATQILEEGLDVQSCNIVVRFDLPSNDRSFIQSRGRARMKDSEYLLMIKRGDTTALTNVTNYLNSGFIMREESLQQAALPCPPLKCEMYDEEYYRVESTGAKVTLSSSVSLIHFYCSRLPSDGYFKPHPRFVIDKASNICDLYLPKSCPIQNITVEGKTDRLKQIASLEAIKKLHQIGALSDYLLPVSEDKLELDSEESGFEYSNEQVNYYPGELVDSWSSYSSYGLYYCYNITLNKHFQSEYSFSDIVLVVKSDLGIDLLKNSFDLEEERGAVSVDVKYVGLVHLNREQVLMARKFQTCVLNLLLHQDIGDLNNAIENLEREQTCMDAAYLILPSNERKINWSYVQSYNLSTRLGAEGRYCNSCTCQSEKIRMIRTIDGLFCRCVLEKSVVYTPHNGYFYCVKGFLNTLNANSTLQLKGGEALTYKTYFKTKHGVDLKRCSQPLLDGRHMVTVQNFLSRRRSRHKKEISSAGVELPPEICKIIMTPILTSILYSFSFVPSIMHRIESILRASKLKSILLDHCMQNVNVSTAKVLEAITAKKCQEAFSLESLETLGDSFLKYATSQHLFKINEHYHQGILTRKRERLVSNANLCRIGCTHHLTGFILNEQFNVKKWIIPGSNHKFEVHKQNQFMSQNNFFNAGMQTIKSKVVADSVEALIGAYLSSAGEKAAFSLLERLGIKVIHNTKEMVVGRPMPNIEKNINVKKLEHMLKYSFNDPSLLLEALTHGSYQVPSFPKCYQRLEFLGDAVLDYLMTLYLHNNYPKASPGLITDLRSASVNNDCYAHAAAKAGLNKHIFHASTDLDKQMTFYLNNFSEKFSGSSHGWEAGIALPKVLADVIESIAGAIYIDSDSNKKIVWESIKPLLEPIVTPETMVSNPLRELNELCTQKSYDLKFLKSSQTGVPSITVEVKADGIVFSETSTAFDKKAAKKKAANDILQILKNAGY